MIVVGIVTGIEGERAVEFREDDGNTTTHRCVNVWVKSADEETQGSWTTIVRLFDDKIAESRENGLSEGSTVSVDIRPTYRRMKSGEFVPTIVNKLISVV